MKRDLLVPVCVREKGKRLVLKRFAISRIEFIINSLLFKGNHKYFFVFVILNINKVLQELSRMF